MQIPVNVHELVEAIQLFVSILPIWLSTNKPTVAHESKTKLMFLHRVIHLVPLYIRFNQNSLEWVLHIKYFRMYLDRMLKRSLLFIKVKIF